MRILTISCLFFLFTSVLFAETGKASFYTKRCSGGGKTANGEHYNETEFTAAHRTLPFGTRVRVINQKTGRSVEVRINDRGPFVRGRVIDLSKAAFSQIASHKEGVVRVAIEVIDSDRQIDPLRDGAVAKVVIAEAARQQRVAENRLGLESTLGDNYRTIVLYVCSRLNRQPSNLAGVNDQTTVRQLIAAIDT